jgi:hypothetical protein
MIQLRFFHRSANIYAVTRPTGATQGKEAVQCILRAHQDGIEEACDDNVYSCSA